MENWTIIGCMDDHKGNLLKFYVPFEFTDDEKALLRDIKKQDQSPHYEEDDELGYNIDVLVDEKNLWKRDHQLWQRIYDKVDKTITNYVRHTYMPPTVSFDPDAAATWKASDSYFIVFTIYDYRPSL